MDFENTLIEELIYIRSQARESKEWALCDQIRGYLDTKHVFIVDTANGQQVSYMLSGTREQFINNLNKDIQAEKRFNAWLYSTKQSIKHIK